jgi:hypothetical protein
MSKESHVAINIRLPRDLHAQLTESAAAREPPVSLNHEIVGRLIRSVRREAQGPPPRLQVPEAMWERLLETWERVLSEEAHKVVSEKWSEYESWKKK